MVLKYQVPLYSNIRYYVKSHRVAAWQLHLMHLNISGSQLSRKVANKYLNVCE